jgi:hypothetical protein
LSTCTNDGYIVGTKYDVYLSYKKSTSARVGESGPWNVDDTYWATIYDPTPRRMFADLPLGMPEAQAAYFNGYNGGLDQYGRVVTGPFGIDLARQVSIDIGLEPGKNDWINVSFMWTEGWDASSGVGDNNVDNQGSNEIQPVQLATPNPDGSIVHIVEPGQSMWIIASAYEVDLSELYSLNGIGQDAVIVPGQELVIKLGSEINPPKQITEVQMKEVEVISSTQNAVTLDIEKSDEEITELSLTETEEISKPVVEEDYALESPNTNTFGIDPILLILLILFVSGVFLAVIGTFVQRS